MFRDHGGRPHWGNVHTHDAAARRRLYPRWDDVQRLRRRVDPEGRFMNDHLRHVLEDPRG